MLRSSRFSLAVLLLLFLITSCDLNAAQNAAEEFDILLGLPSLSSVVTVQALNAENGQPISNRAVEVTFEGADAESVVDIYNDRLEELTVNEGFGTFALDPSESPSPSNPAQVTLRAQVDGYDVATRSVQITQEGSVSRVLRLTKENPEEAAPGTAGAREKVEVRTTGGETTEPTSGQTGETGAGTTTSAKAGSAQASYNIPEGVSLETASGNPLEDPVTMDLLVFDNSPFAQRLLPENARTDENGTHRQVRGAVRFEVRGPNGAANRFVTPGSDTTTVTADFADLGTRTGPATVTLVNPETGAARTETLSSAASSGRTNTAFLFVDSEVIVRSPNGTTTIDRGSGEFQGEFYAVVGVDPNASGACSPGDLTIDPNGQSGSIRVRVSEDGFAVESEVGIPDPESSFTLPASSLYDGDIPALSNATLAIRTTTDQRKTRTIDPCAGSESTLSDPADAADRIDVSVKVEANCPSGERVPISPPFDGYSLGYRLAGSTDPYWIVSRDNITINTTDDAKETITSIVVSLSGVKSGGDYEAVGMYGDQSATLGDNGGGAITMPTEAGAQKNLTDERLTDLCR